MRSFLAGLVILFLVPCGAVAQVTGFVESVGIGGRIRPDCWNPIRVNLTSTVSEPMQYQLQVWQEDLDKDRVVYTREITLSSSNGVKTQEKFELYFVPQPGLCTDQPIITPGQLQKALHIKVCLPPGEGKRPDDAKVVIDPLPVNFTVENIDPRRSGLDWKTPGTRLVLYVTDGTSVPSFGGYSKVYGLAELVEPIAVHPSDLGENVLFYDSVDTVIWLSGNADDLEAAGSHRRAALEKFIRQGGKLVVCQPAERHKIEALGSLLPVETKDANGNWQITFSEKGRFVDEQKSGPDAPAVDALPLLSTPDLKPPRYSSNWHHINTDGKHPIQIARAKPKANAIVELWQPWSKTERSPYIVRGPCGLGCVTWVAQDLGDVSLTGPDSDNWPHIWDHVLGWHNNTLTKLDASSQESYDTQKAQRENTEGGDVDLSQWMLKGTDYASKGAAYVFLAVLFFILYWLAAGPGTYLFLSHKKRKELNWFIFGAWAFVGTALTVLLVRLVLRGDAEVRHLTVVRQVVGEPAYVYSRVGLYIPRDGDQTIALDDTSKDAFSYVTPLQVHSQYIQDTDFPASQIYGIPIHDDPQPVSIRVPFRSTLKKLQLRWVGDLKGGVSGSAKLIASMDNTGVISGTLTNQTGTDLKDIYFVFNYLRRGQTQVAEDQVLFVPRWKKDQALELNSEWADAKQIVQGGVESSATADPRDSKSNIRSPIFKGWDQYWTHWSSGSMVEDKDARSGSDFDENVPKAFPILSLFDRINPSKNDPNNPNNARVDFVRRGGTILNMSSAVAAGRLVVLAQSASDDNPVPFPLSVEGSRVGGLGRVLYQFALPVDRTEMEKDAAKGE